MFCIGLPEDRKLGCWRMDVEEGKFSPSLCWERHLISLCSCYNLLSFFLGFFEEAEDLSGGEIREHCVIERLEMDLVGHTNCLLSLPNTAA